VKLEYFVSGFRSISLFTLVKTKILSSASTVHFYITTEDLWNEEGREKYCLEAGAFRIHALETNLCSDCHYECKCVRTNSSAVWRSKGVRNLSWFCCNPILDNLIVFKVEREFSRIVIIS
jgi:hypothetical protein